MKLMFDNALAKAGPASGCVDPSRKGQRACASRPRQGTMRVALDGHERCAGRPPQSQGFKHKVEHLSYDGAGHLVFMGATRLLPAPQSMARSAPNPFDARAGHAGEAGLKAWTDNWPKTVAFFDAALKGKH